MTAPRLEQLLGDDITDIDEEVFILFSRPFTTQDLGIIDPKATTLEVSVAGRDIVIRQSPGLLTSDRDHGTTGAVTWKVGPLFADWLALSENILFAKAFLDSTSVVMELGSGVSAIVALILAPRIRAFIASDQDYVSKGLNANIEENLTQVSTSPEASTKKTKSKQRRNQQSISRSARSPAGNIYTLTLDWEQDTFSSRMTATRDDLLRSHLSAGLDALTACDCIYNENLIDPFVQTCVDVCKSSRESSEHKQTICLIAQQLRSADIFQAWLEAFHAHFRVWKIPDQYLTQALREGSGYVVHLGILREDRGQF